MEFINELWEANKMTESALLDLNIDESAVNAFDAEGYAKSYSAYSSCSCVNPPCPIATMD